MIRAPSSSPRIGAECQQWAMQQAGSVAQNGPDYNRAMVAGVEGPRVGYQQVEVVTLLEASAELRTPADVTVNVLQGVSFS
jgi:hypothetical protein